MGSTKLQAPGCPWLVPGTSALQLTNPQFLSYSPPFPHHCSKHLQALLRAHLPFSQPFLDMAGREPEEHRLTHLCFLACGGHCFSVYGAESVANCLFMCVVYLSGSFAHPATTTLRESTHKDPFELPIIEIPDSWTQVMITKRIPVLGMNQQHNRKTESKHTNSPHSS